MNIDINGKSRGRPFQAETPLFPPISYFEKLIIAFKLCIWYCWFARVCVCVPVCSYLDIEYQNIHFANKVKTILGQEDFFAGPHNFNNLFGGSDLVWRSGPELGLG